ncbi:MAG: response regulator [Cytophagales bacterium]|nr:response regulator [Cytophagales bacterium]
MINLFFYFTPQLIFHPYDDANFNYLVPISVFSVIFLIVRFFRVQTESYEELVNQKNARLAHDKAIMERQATELKQLDAEKTEFFTNVSHELRTPLTLISGLTETVLEEKGHLNARSESHLFKIGQQAQKLTLMINEILSLAKVGKADYKLLRSPVRLHQFVSKHIDIFQVMAQKSGVNLLYDIHPKNLALMLDENKFDAVFSNLISNAIKYSPTGGDILIEATENKDEIIISISDQGLGIAQQEIDKVFDRFTSTAELHHVSGTGIGLTLVKYLIQLHGGSISAQNNKDKGAKFTIHLPIKWKVDWTGDQPYQRGKELGLPEPHHDIAQILLVEDNADMNLFISDILSSYGYGVIVTSGGLQAMEVLESQKIDLILTDFMMPEMDGYELAKKIKASRKHENTPIIFLTAKSDESERLKVLRLGVNDYILKPFNKQELLVRIENLLNQVKARNEYVSSLENEDLPDSSDQVLIKKLEESIIQDISLPELKVTDIADSLSMTERSLYRKVKAITGLTPKEYMNEIRMQYARKLLENQSYPTLKETAFAIGIRTTNYFCKSYELRFGKHPTEYLHKAENNTST